MTPYTSEMASLSNSRWQNRKERPNQFPNNGGMAEKAKRPVTEVVNLCHLPFLQRS